MSKDDVVFALQPRLWRKLAALALAVTAGSTMNLWWLGIDGFPLLVLAGTVAPAALAAVMPFRSWLRECRTVGVPASVGWLMRRALDRGGHPVARLDPDGLHAPA